MSAKNRFPAVTPPQDPITLTDEQLNCPTLRKLQDQLMSWLGYAFTAGIEEVEQLIQYRTDYIDHLLCRLWQYYLESTTQPGESPPTLIAVGGYGRGELHPLSDIDILFLSKSELSESQQQHISDMIVLLWDIKLDLAQSVRTLAECITESRQDLTVYTNLLEARFIIGEHSLFSNLCQQVHHNEIWTSATFFAAKYEEQIIRHQHYHSTTYNLEPDIKASPGGLRDIHIIQWISRQHFATSSLPDLYEKGFMTKSELNELKECQHFLWRIRFALHLLIPRYDNRLSFDRQLEVAALLGYEGQGNQPVEQMMKEYYRITHHIRELNMMFLQLFDETILENNKMNITILDDYFQLQDDLIDLRDKQLFQQQPVYILKMFYHLAKNGEIKGIYAETQRQLRNTLRQLPISLSELAEARQLFIAILQQPHAITRAIQPMHQHQFLSAYIPQWEHIAGLMQFDLFHAYTVDEHTIRVLLHLEQFADKNMQTRHPLCVEVYPQLEDKLPLFFAALFHDIAKGRGRDHSQLGAEEAMAFARLHQLDESRCQLIGWLVQEHLTMSITAQRRDIYDPIVIQQFSEKMQNEQRLQYLLCLTVADICATNASLWNSWKQTLLKELYYTTLKQLQRGVNLPDTLAYIRQQKKQALALLMHRDINEKTLVSFWAHCRADYFLRHTPEQLAWHAEHLLENPPNLPLVLINPQVIRGGTEIFIYSINRPYLFATVAGELERRNLSIHDAQIITSQDNMAMDTFIVLEPQGTPLAADRHPSIKLALEQALKQNHYHSPRKRHPSIKLRHFNVATNIKFLPTHNDKRTYMELVALDQPGLLARVSEVFVQLKLALHGARITTIGEQVEDLFILTDQNNQSLSLASCELLRQTLTEALTTDNIIELE